MKKHTLNPATDHDSLHGDELTITIGDNGDLKMIYDDRLNPKDSGINELGKTEIIRASHVEPSSKDIGHWDVDLTPSGGPIITGFKSRALALTEEVKWLEENVLRG